MKFLLVLGMVALAAGSAVAAPGATAEAESQVPAPPARDTTPAPPPGVKLAAAVSTTTGLAISPLLGVGAAGAWQYWRTPAAMRARMPWFASPWFWVPALGLVALLALKEPALYFLPGAKKPLDLLEVMENKASALVAAPLVIQLAIQTFSRAETTTGTSVVTAGWTLDGWFGLALGGIGLLAIFACVWMVSHAVNILILLSPSATLDMLLRASRAMVLVAVTLSAAISPWLGLLVAIAVIYTATRLFGWAWRLMAYGGTLAIDWLGGRKTTGPDQQGRARAFLARPGDGLPTRTRGHLKLSVTGDLVFTGRALPWQAERTVVFDAAAVSLARGLIGPVLQAGSSPFSGKLVSLPPRFTGAELALGGAFGIAATAEHPAQRTWAGALAWLRECQGRATLAGGSGTDAP